MSQFISGLFSLLASLVVILLFAWVARALLEAVGEPLLSTTLHVPDEEFAGHEAEAVAERSLRWVDAMLDAGDCEPGPTTVVDCTGDEPQVVREGHRPLPELHG